MPRSRMVDQVGRVVGGRYRLLAPVGTGASADVYVADDVTLRRRVAVKVLHDALAGDDGFLRRFRAEARAVASLRHHNIMAVFDWGEEEDGPFLVLEYLGGGSLRDLLDRGHRLSPSQATLIGLEAARGLDHAHRRGLVHRDIKPANLLFDDEGRLAIADFGIARALAEATWTEPAGAVVGTVRYASPEQARGNSIDGRADVYALALVLVEAVTGTVPFSADTTIATLMARLDRSIPTSDRLGPLAGVIEAAGAVDPADRVDASGLVRALEAIAGRLPRPEPLPLTPSDHLPTVRGNGDDRTMMASLEEAAPSAVEATKPKAEVPAASPEPAKPKRRARWRYPWIAVTAILVALAVAFAVLVVPGLRQPTYTVLDYRKKPWADIAAPAHFKLVRHDVRVGPPFQTVVDQNPRPGKHHAGTITVDVSISYALVAVPDLGGMSVTEAKAALAAVNLALATTAPTEVFSDTVPAGHIVAWSNPHAQIPQHDTVSITLSGGPRNVPMPDVVGQTSDKATSILHDAGITVPPNIVQAFSDTVAPGSVISSDPPAGSPADRAAPVTLTVSKGPDLVAVPSLSGDSVSAAEAALNAVGLIVGGPYGPPGSGTVDFTSPGAGHKVKRGSTVVLYVGYF